MAKTITFTTPPGAITDLTATLLAGGSLATGKTYYYKVIAVNTTGLYWVNVTFSGTSNEVTATTSAGNQQIQLDWTKTANALAYFVLRTEVQGDYSMNDTKFNGASGYYYPTVGDVNTWTDDGSANPDSWSPSLSACKSTSKFPMNLDPQTNGIGQLQLSGGSAGDPITPADIYADAVANGWTNWCNWDGQNFGLMATLWFQDTEVHFQARKGTFAVVGGYIWLSSANASSNIQFGMLVGGQPYDSVHITSIGNYYRPFYIHRNCKIYGGGLTGVAIGGEWDSDTYITYTNYLQSWYNCELKDISIEGYSRWQHISATAPVAGCRIINGNFDVMNHGKYYVSDVEVVNNRILTSYYDCPRMDRFTSSNVASSYSYSIYGGDYAGTTTSNFIDFKHPYLSNPDGTPIIYWNSPTDTCVINFLNTFQLKVTDKDGNPIENVIIDLNDVDGNAGVDIQTDEIKSLTTDSDGRLWLDKINITGVTDNTITDSSKNWVVDEWAGRNVYCEDNGELMKVYTNTSDTLTFTADFVSNPSTSTNAGIRIEVLRLKSVHNVATGNGAGSAYTTQTWYTPHSITISKDGYETYKGVINFNEAKSLDIKLYRSPFATRIGRE